MAKAKGGGSGGVNPQTLQGAVGNAFAKSLGQTMLKAMSGKPKAQLQNTFSNLFKSLGPSAGFARLKTAMANMTQAAAKAAGGQATFGQALRSIGPAARAAVGAIPVLGPALMGAAGAVMKLADMASGLVSAAAQKGGGAGLSQAFETLAETIGTLLLPVMTAITGVIMAVTDVIWGALQPALGGIFKTIVAVLVPAGAALIGTLFTVAKFMLGEVIPAFIKVANWAYKVATAVINFLSPMFDWLGRQWRTVSIFVSSAVNVLITSFSGLGSAISTFVGWMADLVAAIDVFGAGLADPLRAAARLIAPAPAGAAPVVPPMGGGPAPLIDPTFFTKMADAIPDPTKEGGMKDMMGRMIGGMKRALTETEFARFGNQGGFKGIAEAWKSAQIASFRSPEEAKRDKMALEAISTLKKILAVAEDALGIVPAVGD